ncbi:hypothetical protein WA556_005327, partial [Blastocystis sp. ATCC 50177/Nand II]
MSTNRISKIFGSDSKSLWNVTLAPGWTKAEAEVLRCAIMKYGIGSWKQITSLKLLPGKTVSQIVCQVQRMIGQQSLKEFLKLHADVLVIGRENAKRTDVHRKNGIIVNEGHNMTPQEVKQRRMYNLKKYGLSNEEIDKVVIPVLSEKQTSEVFDKRTNKQLEREQLLSRLAVLRSALQYLQKGSPDGAMSAKKRRVGGRRKRRSMYDSDSLSDSDDDISALDFSSMPKRQSRRQRGLAPEFSDASNDLY